MSRYIQSFFSLLWTFLSYFVCVTSFKSMNSSSLSRKNYGEGFFTVTPCRQLQGEIPLVGIGLIDLTEHCDTLGYKPFFKHYILQTILHAFLLFAFVWNRTFPSKNWAVFYIFLFRFGVVLCVAVLKVLCFWCSAYKVIGNMGFFSYSRYNLLGIAQITVLLEKSTDTYFQHYLIHYRAKT